MLILWCCGGIYSATAQVSPQSQDGKAVLWAVLQADISLSKQWNSSTIFGYSRRSFIGNFAAYENFGLWCLRQEFARPLSKRFRITLGAFYSQIGTAGDESSESHYLHEIRFYPKLYYDLTFGRSVLTFQFRTDLRYFFPDVRTTEASYYQSRQRLSAQITAPLSPDKRRILVLNSELLASADYAETDDGRFGWRPYRFRDVRLRAFFRVQTGRNVWLDFGHMTQLRLPFATAKEKLWSGYLAVGLLVKNPFTKHKQKAE